MARLRWAPVALIVLALAVAVVAVTGTRHDRVLSAEFESATLVLPGLDVRQDGLKVGTVEDVAVRDGRALVRLRIDADRAWPLHQGTTAEIRLSSALGYANRYIALEPGPPTEPAIPNHGVIDASNATAPVEFDRLLDVFDRRTRGNLRALLNNADRALSGHERALRAGIGAAPGGLEPTAGLLVDLAADQPALERLVAGGSRTMATLARRSRAVTQLVAGLATTLDAVAARSGDVRRALRLTAPALRNTRVTLAELDRALDPLERLVVDIAPGARQVSPLAAAARPAIARLVRVGPQLRAALRTGTRAAPAITGLLADGAPAARRLQTVLPELEPMVHCLQAYAPEFAGFLAIWGVHTSKNYDALGHYVRTEAVGMAAQPGVAGETSAMVTAMPGLRYALPRPPGLSAGKPRFMPECGIDKRALDPKQDPEAR